MMDSIIGGLFNLAGSRMQNLANAKEAHKNREFQLNMSNTAHQREVADLRAAGLNPILSGTGGSGAAVTAGATAQHQNMGAAATEGYRLGQAQADAHKLMKEEIAKKAHEASSAYSRSIIDGNEERLSKYMYGTETYRDWERTQFPALAAAGDARQRELQAAANLAHYSAFDAKIDYDLNRDHEQAERVRRLSNRTSEAVSGWKDAINPLRGMFSPSSARGGFPRREPYLGSGLRR